MPFAAGAATCHSASVDFLAPATGDKGNEAIKEISRPRWTNRDSYLLAGRRNVNPTAHPIRGGRRIPIPDCRLVRFVDSEMFAQ